MNKLCTFILSIFILLSSTALSQTYTISGKVTDGMNGEALIGANIYLQGTSWGAASDAIIPLPPNQEHIQSPAALLVTIK
jgi:hypothetical protein